MIVLVFQLHIKLYGCVYTVHKIHSANIYMAHLEEEFLLKNALDYSPTFYRRYVDDTFCLFKEKDHIKRFMNFMNGIDAAIQFDMELEHQDKLSFLDTIIKRNVNNLYPDVSNKYVYIYM